MSEPLSPAAQTLDAFGTDLSIGKTTIYKLIKEGKLKTVKLGRKTLVLKVERDRFLASLMERAA
jgi:excisionase family DNA binding protein